jgi:N-acyl-D-aspartate/D-glutamate deacylase
MTETDRDVLIQGGKIIDGTGAPAFIGDVRIRAGVIAEIAPTLESHGGERVFDASGCYVAPGFIESHTHVDGTMWWQSDLDPLPGNGVTTVIMGNCGFALAPLHDDPAVRAEVVKIFSFFEDIPEGPFFEKLPWDWKKWSEYRDSVTSQAQVATNYAAFVGHIALRLAVMGMEAWERAATPEEIRRIASLLEDALAAGALGLSTNLMDHDGQDRPVPSLHADDAELAAILEVLARHPGATLRRLDGAARAALRGAADPHAVGGRADAAMAEGFRPPAAAGRSARALRPGGARLLDGLHACPDHDGGERRALAALCPVE